MSRKAVVFLLGVGGGLLPVVAAAQIEFGCYDVLLGEWSPIDSTHVADLPRPPPPDQSGDSAFYSLPSRLRLRGELGARARTDWFLVTVPPNTLQVPHAGQTWNAVADTLRIDFSGRFGGTSSTLYRTPDGWEGLARTRSDVGGVLRYERPIALAPADCDSPAPVPASLDRPLLRRIELAGGGVLELGQPLPPGVTTFPRRSGAWRVDVEAVGTWAGNDTVVVRLDPQGTVFHIEFRYPDGFDLAPLLDSLDAAFGTRRNSFGITPSWTNRTTRIFIGLAGPRVVLIDRRYR